MATGKQTKILVSDSISKSIRIAETFGLDRKEWKLAAFGDSLSGKKYETAVVFWPKDHHPMYEAWFDDILRKCLPKNYKPANF